MKLCGAFSIHSLISGVVVMKKLKRVFSMAFFIESWDWPAYLRLTGSIAVQRSCLLRQRPDSSSRLGSAGVVCLWDVIQTIATKVCFSFLISGDKEEPCNQATQTHDPVCQPAFAWLPQLAKNVCADTKCEKISERSECVSGCDLAS